MTFIQVVLTIVILTGPDQPNSTHVLQMPNMDVCFEEAKEFTHHHLPDKVDAKVLKFECAGKLGDPS